MTRHQSIDKAIESIKAAISTSSDVETTYGLEKALLLIERAIPDLEGALSSVVSALDDASTVVDASEDEEYAYQGELEGGRAALSRLANVDYEPSQESDLEMRHYSRIMDVGSGDARGVYAKMIGKNYDAIMAEVVVYGFVEGFSRAAGNPPGNYMRFHEHIHLNVGADLPEGLTADALYEEAIRIADGNQMNGFTLQKMEDFAIKNGMDFHAKIARSSNPRFGS